MKRCNILEEKYLVNLNLNVLYEILDKFYNYGDEAYYPSEIRLNMKALLNSINKYIYHSKKGYDIVGEKYYSIVTYQKN